MFKIAALVLALFIGVAPTSIAQRRFDTLMQHAAMHGTVMSTDFGVYRTLTRLVPNNDQTDHSADYFSAVSGHVEIVSERWTKSPNGDWIIFQWLFTLDRTGVVVDATHRLLVETTDGELLGDTPLALPESKQSLAAAFADDLASWYAAEGI